MNEYIFIGPTSPMTYHMVGNLFKLKNVKFYKAPLNIKTNKFEYIFIHSIYHLESVFGGALIAKLVSLFCRRRILKIADANQYAVFVYWYPWIGSFAASGIIDEIRHKYHNIKHVAIFYDIQIMKNHNLTFLKKKYDLVSTYDENEARKAGVVFIPPVYSKEYDVRLEIDEYYDVFFLGKAKDRFKIMLDVYDKLEEDGFVCRFFVFGVPNKEQVPRGGITYLEKEMPVEDAYQYTRRAKCLLELVPYNTSALTGRYREAIIYDKKLLSNNIAVIKDKYYNPDMIYYFHDAKEIDTGFLNKPIISYGYKGDYEAINLLKRIEDTLDI